jgi:hypothetical protein
MGTSSKALAEKLRKLAARQHGCFTAAQAIDIGYADSVHLYHVKNGKWVRISRGIYRLADAPETPAARCMAALLWTRGKDGLIQGFLRQDTVAALLQHELLPGTPIQIGVPKGFRRSSLVPAEILLSFVGDSIPKTSKMAGLRVEATPDDPAPPASQPPPEGDLPDYYDWLDYQAVLCARDT